MKDDRGQERAASGFQHRYRSHEGGPAGEKFEFPSENQAGDGGSARCLQQLTRKGAPDHGMSLSHAETEGHWLTTKEGYRVFIGHQETHT